MLIFDTELADTVRGLIADCPNVESYIQVADIAPVVDDLPGNEYEAMLADATPVKKIVEIDELETIAINYTSGTTGFPKGVVFHARGAYLNALGEALETGLTAFSVYLWTLPLFHCNGWCFPWGVTAVGGTHICLRKIDPAEVYRLITAHNVSHLCCAPTVLTALYSSEAAEGQRLDKLTITTAGAPPAPHVIRTMEGMGATVHHVYGLTECYGPHTICAEQPGWDLLDPAERGRVKARQGVPYGIAHTGLGVVDSDLVEVPWDGETLGEVLMRGNNVMTGYHDDAEATAKAFAGGWFHSGDLAVRHPDGYIELRDRAKDIIISGGENISSQEVEKVIMDHPDVLEVSVIGVPDEKWGEVPKAFVVPVPGSALTAASGDRIHAQEIVTFQVPQACGVRGVAEDCDRENSEICSARTRVGGSREADSRLARSPLFHQRHRCVSRFTPSLELLVQVSGLSRHRPGKVLLLADVFGEVVEFKPARFKELDQLELTESNRPARSRSPHAEFSAALEIARKVPVEWCTRRGRVSGH